MWDSKRSPPYSQTKLEQWELRKMSTLKKIGILRVVDVMPSIPTESFIKKSVEESLEPFYWALQPKCIDLLRLLENETYRKLRRDYPFGKGWGTYIDSHIRWGSVFLFSGQWREDYP